MENVKNENFVVIQGFMVKELQLKGNELMIYAIIYGFSQLDGQCFKGSLQYLADWTNSTRQGVTKCLKSLIDKGLIEKNSDVGGVYNKVTYCTTKFNKVYNSVAHDVQQSLTGCTTKFNTINNNIYIQDNNTDNKKDNIGDKKENNIKANKVVYFPADDLLNDAFVGFIENRKKLKKPMTDRAIELAIKELDKLAGNDNDLKIQIINQSILYGYQGLFPLRSDNQNNKSKAKTQSDLLKELNNL